MNGSWLKFALHNTLRNRRRSAVTISITALGTAAILLAGGFASFTYHGLSQSAARTTGHLIIAKAAQFSKDEDTPLQHGLDKVSELRQQLLDDPDVRYVLPKVEFSGLISNGDKSTVMMATGIDPDAEFAVKGPFLRLRAGKVLRTGQHNMVMLGESLAKSLKASPGSSLTLLASTTDGALNALDVIVVGIVSTGTIDIDKRLVFTDVETAQKLLVTERVSSLGVFLSGMDATDPAQARLQKVFKGLEVRTWLDQATFYRSVKSLYNRIFGALGLIIGVIVIFVVSNSMAMTIIERTREIGTLRALGTLPRQLIGSLALEGLILSAGGALLGAVVSLSISGLLLIFPVDMPPAPGRTVGYPLQIAADPLLYLMTLLGMLLLAALASSLIARHTVQMPVVKALAHV